MCFEYNNEAIKLGGVVEGKVQVTVTCKDGRVLNNSYWIKDDGEATGGSGILECIKDILNEERFQNPDAAITGALYPEDRNSYIQSLHVTDFGRVVINKVVRELFFQEVVIELIKTTLKSIDYDYESFDNEERSTIVKDELYLYPNSERDLVRERIRELLTEETDDEESSSDAFTIISSHDLKLEPELNDTLLDSCVVSFGFVTKVITEPCED